MKDQLLTEEEVKLVMHEANTNGIYDQQNLLFLNNWENNYYGIVKKSLKGLIFVEGNEETGFKHISNRHLRHSNKYYWKEGKLDTPSRFSNNIIPIDHFAQIADDIYCTENLHNEKNNHVDKFDLYEGESIQLDKGSTEYRMLLYKNSTIVHTLFPLDNKSKQNKLKHFNYVKGKITIVTPLTEENLIEFEIPYFDDQSRVRYIIIFKINNDTGEESVELKVNPIEGESFFVLCEINQSIKPNADLKLIENAKSYANYLYLNELIFLEKIIQGFEIWEKCEKEKRKLK